MDVRWFALASSVDYAAIALFLYISYRRHGGPKLRFSWRKSRSILKVSYNYILSTFMIVLYGQTDKLMIKQIIGGAEVGYYATAVAICSMWTFVLQAIIDSLYPTILRLKNENQLAYEKKNRQLYAIVFYVSCAVSLGFLLLGDFVVNLLYGAEFLPASDVLKVVTWYTAFSYLGVARNAWIVSEGKQKYLKYMYACAAGINIALNSVMIPIWGAVGAAIASLITEMLTSILLPLCIKDLRPSAKLMLEAISIRKLK
jgi:O-antigen/teichoic acid export membrane protein